MSRYYDIRLTFCDEANNRFLMIGGTSCRSKREQSERWDAIPAVSDSPFIADRIGPNRIDIIDDRQISQTTVERLTGKSVAVLIGEAQENR